MKSYLGVKLIKAQPMTYSENCNRQGFPMEPGKENDEGYLVEYPNGHQSWSPAAEFEAAYLELNEPSRITSGDLIRFLGIDPYAVDTLDEKTTLVRMITRTGFASYETSSCVDPANYNAQLGAEICIDRLNTKLWELLGFVLQWGKHGLDKVGEMPMPQRVTDTETA